jgi:hypothetical protein
MIDMGGAETGEPPFECDGDPVCCDCGEHENARRAEASHAEPEDEDGDPGPYFCFCCNDANVTRSDEDRCCLMCGVDLVPMSDLKETLAKCSLAIVPAPRSDDLGDEIEPCGCEESEALRAELTEATGWVEALAWDQPAPIEQARAWLKAHRVPAQPAAPEPSLDRFFGAVPDMPLEPAAPEPSADLKECESRLHEQWTMRQTLLRRLETAEAQLAAVRDALSMPGYYVEKDPDDLLGSEIAEMQSCLAEAFKLLTPAPEPSADPPVEKVLDLAEAISARAEAADSQLAALRERVETAMRVCSMRVPPDVNAWWADTLGPLLTPAPSPGARCLVFTCDAPAAPGRTHCPAHCTDPAPSPGAGQEGDK